MFLIIFLSLTTPIRYVYERLDFEQLVKPISCHNKVELNCSQDAASPVTSRGATGLQMLSEQELKFCFRR